MDQWTLPWIRLCLTISLSMGLSCILSGQGGSLLDLLEDEEEAQELVSATFKSSRVINGHSVVMLAPGALDFRILHRFGPVNRGLYDMFGLDLATMRIGFDYGITRYLTAGIGRSTNKKEWDGFVKWRILAQQRGKRNIPLSLVWVSGMTVNGLRWENPDRENLFTSRLAYYHQILVGSKVNEWVSLQLAPTVVHRNLVATVDDPHDIFSLGIGGRVKLTKRVALTWDYFYVFNPTDPGESKNPLSLGLDIETGGHVFQLHFSNAIGMNERAFLLDTRDTWTSGEVRFGFNLSRMFQIKRYPSD